MQPPIVVNVKVDECDEYIMRPTMWGNPFIPGRDGTREEVIAKYRRWILTQPRLLAKLPTLAGKRLGCKCKPQACHGDVLVELVAALPEPGMP